MLLDPPAASAGRAQSTSSLFDSAPAVESILRPRSVVVIGASTNEATMAGAPVRNLLRHGYSGRVYVVNPRRTEVAGVRSYARVADLPERPDTAVLVVGAELVAQSLRDCAAVGIPSATVVASGFSEGAAGENGADRTLELESILHETGIRIVGPNTAGLMNIADNYVPRAALNHPSELRAGDAAIVTQSGALCNTLMNRTLLHGVGLSYVVATGDQLDLDLWDVASVVLQDERTHMLLMIIEGFKSPEKFLRVASLARQLRKPIVALKIGGSELGSQVVATHSGALAGSAAVQRAVLAEQNVIAVSELDELWEVAQLLQRWGVPEQRTARLGIVSMSGGEAALAADYAAPLDLQIPTPSESTRAQLDGLSDLAKGANPFDTTGAVISEPDLLGRAMRIMLNSHEFDAVVAASPAFADLYAERMYQSVTDATRDIPQAHVAVSAWTAGDLTRAGQSVLRASGLPVFKGVQRVLRAIHYYDTYGARSLRPTAEAWAANDSVQSTDSAATRTLSYWQAREALSAVDVPFNRAWLVKSPDAALAAARDIGFPVSVKLSHTQVVHKAALGAVFLLLADAESVRRAAEHLLGLVGRDLGDGEGVVVEQYVGSFAAALIGGSRDPEFGPVLLFGLGGGYAEAYADVARATCPVSAHAVHELVSSTRFSQLLTRRPETRRSIEDLLLRLGEWFGTDPTAHAFDLNPILIGSDGSIVAVDARLEVVQPAQPHVQVRVVTTPSAPSS